jgi:hypothetical protein
MKLTLPVFLALGIYGAQALNLLPVPEEHLEPSVNGVWSDGHGALLTVLGVCSVDPKNMGCWDTQGAISPSLAEKLKSRLGGGDQFRDFDFRFGKKNRYLIFQYERGLSPKEFSSATTPIFRAMDGILVRDVSTYMSGQPGGKGQLTFAVVHLIAEPSKTHFDAVATIGGLPGPPPVTVSFKDGAKAQHDGQTITLGGWAKGGLPQPGDPYYGFRFVPAGGEDNSAGWTLFFGFNPGGVSLNLTALDKGGKEIQYVDSHGHPVSESEFKKNGPKFPEPYPMVPVTGNYAEAKISPGFDAVYLERAKAYCTNIDPKYIAQLRIATTHSKSVLFKDVPLEPLKFKSVSGSGAR